MKNQKKLEKLKITELFGKFIELGKFLELKEIIGNSCKISRFIKKQKIFTNIITYPFKIIFEYNINNDKLNI